MVSYAFLTDCLLSTTPRPFPTIYQLMLRCRNVDELGRKGLARASCFRIGRWAQSRAESNSIARILLEGGFVHPRYGSMVASKSDADDLSVNAVGLPIGVGVMNVSFP